MVRIAIGCLLALLAFGATGAAAEPVQQFAVQLKDATPDGRFSVVFTSNSFDTTGAAPPALTEASVRFAKGISINPRFLRRNRLCRTGNLRSILLDSRTDDLTYEQMLDDLPATQRRIGKRLTPESLKILDACRRAYLGSGKYVIDARPLVADEVPGSLYMFLSEPTVKGAVAGFGIMAFNDRTSPAALNSALIAAQQPVFTVNLFNEPTRDGLYGYRLKLLPENLARMPFSVAELRVESKGIVVTTRKRTYFWASLPDCPASGNLPFKADYTYTTGLRTSTVIQVACPRFRR